MKLPASKAQPEPLGQPLLLTRRQLAHHLNVTERTVAAWDLTGRIPAVRIGRTVRYHADDVIGWLRKSGGAR